MRLCIRIFMKMSSICHAAAMVVLAMGVMLGLGLSAHAAAPGNIFTLAGNGISSFGGDGGAATSAGLWYPFGVTMDSAGNLYIATPQEHRIHKVVKQGATSAAISHAPPGPFQAGDQVEITASFNDLVADAPVPQIALGGANTLVATSMTKVDYRTYRYLHTVTPGTGSITFGQSSGYGGTIVPPILPPLPVDRLYLQRSPVWTAAQPQVQILSPQPKHSKGISRYRLIPFFLSAPDWARGA